MPVQRASFAAVLTNKMVVVIAAEAPVGVALNTAALPKWWQRFRDPVLNELVEVALRSSPDIRTAVSKVRESRARRHEYGRSSG